MKDISFRLLNYFKYLVSAKSKYYLHSPFVYQFYVHVLEGNKFAPEIEKIRKKLYQNHTKISFTDYGNHGITNTLSISHIAQRSSISPKYGKLLFNLVDFFQPDNIIELGTNLGLGTLYMACGNRNAKIHTIEGSSVLCNIAEKNFRELGIANITLHHGSFDDLLPNIALKIKKLDLVFFDGHHKMKPTLVYFETCLKYVHDRTIFIFDDINWSKEMNKSWQLIKDNPKVTVSIDLHRMGLAFFCKQKLAREHFILYF
jgi:predicted O-methyltransferase YrrM